MTSTTILVVLFWVFFAIVFYAYLGYGILLFLILKIRKRFGLLPNADQFLPRVTHVIAAFNEEDWIGEKIKNSLALDYPKEKLDLLFVTDGSDDATPALVEAAAAAEGARFRHFFQPQRQGKIAAVQRVMEHIDTPFIVFSDANTDLNPQAIRLMMRHFYDEKVGAVAGEKRIRQGDVNDASGAGEGIYWKYESQLKKWDAQLYSVVGAAGELFAVRKSAYEHVPSDTIIEDFYMTLRIAQRGFRVTYEPAATAEENQSEDVGEELKRKIRIAAGGLQAIARLSPLLNVFKYGWLSFQYISHRVLRWTLAPLALPIIFITNLLLAWQGLSFYQFTMIVQLLFYALAIGGAVLARNKIKLKVFFVPYYFAVMNYAVFRGFGRIISGRQSVLWERAKRAQN